MATTALSVFVVWKPLAGFGLGTIRQRAPPQCSISVLYAPPELYELVPSLTEAVASTDASLLAGVTRYCSHPPGLAAERVGGTKNPDVPRIIELKPDVVLANEEENRAPDLAALRAAGISVWVTKIRTLPEALGSLDRMLTIACRLPGPAWLDAAAAAWAQVAGEEAEQAAQVAPAR